MRPNVRPGIFLYGYFGAGNLGDDLLLAVSIAELRPILPDVRFYVRDHGDTAALHPGTDVAFTGIEQILADKKKSRFARLIAYMRAYMQIFRQCRWLIFSGGTLFHERGTMTALALQWLICLLARMQGVRIAALGVGVAELRSGVARWLLRRIIGMSDLFLVRDDAALRQCRNTKARLTADLVFAWSDLKPPSYRGNDASRIGLTVYPPACTGPAGTRVRAALVDAIRQWQAAGHVVVYLVCQREGVTTGDATDFTLLTAELGASAQKIETRTIGTSAAVISQQLGDLSVICGMRFHALVLAAMSARPFIGVAHDNKITEICRAFAMPCYSVDELTAEKLVTAIGTIEGRLPDSALVQGARHLAQENFRAFAALAT